MPGKDLHVLSKSRSSATNYLWRKCGTCAELLQLRAPFEVDRSLANKNRQPRSLITDNGHSCAECWERSARTFQISLVSDQWFVAKMRNACSAVQASTFVQQSSSVHWPLKIACLARKIGTYFLNLARQRPMIRSENAERMLGSSSFDLRTNCSYENLQKRSPIVQLTVLDRLQIDVKNFISRLIYKLLCFCYLRDPLRSSFIILDYALSIHRHFFCWICRSQSQCLLSGWDLVPS